MDCRECQKKMHAYLTGQVDEISRKKILHHISDCPVCSEVLVQEEALDCLMDEVDSHIPDIDIGDKVMDMIRPYGSSDNNVATYAPRPKRTLNQPFSLLQDILAAAAAAIIIFSGFNAASLEMKVPNYGAVVNSVSGSIGHITSSYVQVSSDTVSNIFINLEKVKLFSEGDEQR